MPRGGARPGAGRKPKPKTPDVRDKNAAAQILQALNRPADPKDSYEVQRFRDIDNHSPDMSLDLRKYLYDKRDGKAVHTVNHLHDKPLDVNMTLSLGEGMKLAMKKAEERIQRR